jgi:hypothetical protein
VDFGDGVILRYNEESEEVLGMTLIGLKNRLLKGWGRVCSPETHFPGTCAN